MVEKRFSHKYTSNLTVISSLIHSNLHTSNSISIFMCAKWERERDEWNEGMFNAVGKKAISMEKYIRIFSFHHPHPPFASLFNSLESPKKT